MGRIISSLAIFDHVWADDTKAVGNVLLNKKELLEQSFLAKLKGNKKIT
jgi:hypothetical protein